MLITYSFQTWALPQRWGTWFGRGVDGAVGRGDKQPDNPYKFCCMQGKKKKIIKQKGKTVLKTFYLFSDCFS